jgi:hypothetical protein
VEVPGKDTRALELTHVEHALALTGALAIANAGGVMAYWLVLTVFPVSTSGGSMHPIAIAFSSFRHAGLFALAVVVMNIAHHRLRAPRGCLPAAALGLLVRFLGVVGDWVASRSNLLVDEGPTYYAGRGLGSVLVTQFGGLLGVRSCLDCGAIAIGLVLAARFRGRWIEGFLLRAASTIVGALWAVFFLQLGIGGTGYLDAILAKLALSLLLVSLLVPVSERIVRSGFVAIGVREPDP